MSLSSSPTVAPTSSHSITFVPPSAPGAALSTEQREAGTRAAVIGGLSASALTFVALFGSHKLFTRTSTLYASIPASPLRVFAAVAVTGAFAYTAGLSQARHSTQVNIEYAQAIEMRDSDMKRESLREGGKTVKGTK
jgi:hypothetical protein